MLGRKLQGASAGAEAALAIEDVFSTYLYTGNGTSQTITNGIDLAGEGGLVWHKNRSSGSTNHVLTDTIRGASNFLYSNTTAGQGSGNWAVDAFNNTGYSISSSDGLANGFGQLYASWTFRQAPRFFDVVTYTGTGANRTIAHDLGVVPGCIIVKRTDTTGNWQVYHRSLANTEYMVLNSTAAKATGATRWNSTTPTSSVFSLGTDATVNASGGTYVAYIYAHDPLGPSGDGSDGLIACGSFTTDVNALATVSLGWEPQWVMVKRTDSTTNGSWFMLDTMRGWATGTSSGANDDRSLLANSSDAEGSPNGFGDVTSTGFVANGIASSAPFIYIAIRRGPMREPTVGTEVFGLSARTGTGANATVTGGQTADAFLVKNRGSAVADLISSRMTGTGYLITSTGNGEVAAGTTILQANPWDVMNGVKVGTTSTITNASSNTFINYLFRRAPGFFDVVAYTGTGSARTISHNLGAVPELLIVKSRGITANWAVYSAPTGAAQRLELDSAAESAAAAASFWNLTTPTSAVFSVGSAQAVNQSSTTYIAYLFASLPGISKVGSYTGNGSNQTINCAFTTGARFILIKRTDVAGDWYVWDTARGIIAGNDPHFSLNTTAAEVTSNDTIDPDSTGFIVNQVAATNVNVNAATYIFLAIA